VLLFTRKQKFPGETDLVPYWLYPLKGGAVIERHVPALPLSRDLERYEALCRSLAVYRIAFGQSRQDDLIAFLLTQMPEVRASEVAQQLRIDLSPGRVAGSRGPTPLWTTSDTTPSGGGSSSAPMPGS
jgi:hypothetical protein